MGEPGADLATRLQQVHAATSRIEQRSARLPVAVRQLYAVLLFGSTTLPDIASAFRSLPSINLIISNMRGPQGQRYLAGAPMTVFQGCPVVPPGAGLKVSFVTVNDDICLAVGAAPEAVEDPSRITALIMAGLAALEAEVNGEKSPPGTRRKTNRKGGGNAGKKSKTTR